MFFCYKSVDNYKYYKTRDRDDSKNKMEEIKSGYVYIDNNRYYFLDLGEIINFKEQDYDISISIRPWIIMKISAV